jgi:Arc/MetJ-type ribon-helix-helix transcriptional regulator
MTQSKRRPAVVTSVYLPLDDLEWIRSHRDSTSAFIREAVSEKIDREMGFASQIKRVQTEICVLDSELNTMKAELHDLENKQSKWLQNTESERINDLLVRATTNIRYETWQDAAEDLLEAKGSLTDEQWNQKVREVWEATQEIDSTT